MWRAARGWAGRRQCARPASHARQAWPVATGLPARHGWATSSAMAPQCQLGNQSPKLSQSTLHPIDSRAGRRQSGGRLHLWGSAPGWRLACIAAQHGRQIKNCTNATGHLHHSLQRKAGAPIVAVANDAHVVGSALQLAVADQCLHRLEQGRRGNWCTCARGGACRQGLGSSWKGNVPLTSADAKNVRAGASAQRKCSLPSGLHVNHWHPITGASEEQSTPTASTGRASWVDNTHAQAHGKRHCARNASVRTGHARR